MQYSLLNVDSPTSSFNVTGDIFDSPVLSLNLTGGNLLDTVGHREFLLLSVTSPFKEQCLVDAVVSQPCIWHRLPFQLKNA